MVRPGFEPTASRSANRILTHWANRAVLKSEKFIGFFIQKTKIIHTPIVIESLEWFYMLFLYCTTLESPGNGFLKRRTADS